MGLGPWPKSGFGSVSGSLVKVRVRVFGLSPGLGLGLGSWSKSRFGSGSGSLVKVCVWVFGLSPGFSLGLSPWSKSGFGSVSGSLVKVRVRVFGLSPGLGLGLGPGGGRKKTVSLTGEGISCMTTRAKPEPYDESKQAKNWNGTLLFEWVGMVKEVEEEEERRGKSCWNSW